MKRNEDSLSDFWDNITHTNICIIEVPEGEESKGVDNIFEAILAENFPYLGKVRSFPRHAGPGSTKNSK